MSHFLLHHVFRFANVVGWHFIQYSYIGIILPKRFPGFQWNSPKKFLWLKLPVIHTFTVSYYIDSSYCCRRHYFILLLMMLPTDLCNLHVSVRLTLSKTCLPAWDDFFTQTETIFFACLTYHFFTRTLKIVRHAGRHILAFLTETRRLRRCFGR